MDAAEQHTWQGAGAVLRIGGSAAMRRKACSECGQLAVVCHGQGDDARFLCFSCMDARCVAREDTVLVCTVEGCEEAPAFIVEEIRPQLVRHLLCRQHFSDYNGFFSRVFALTSDARREDCDPNVVGELGHVLEVGPGPVGAGPPTAVKGDLR
jgi:hypothetical protein